MSDDISKKESRERLREHARYSGIPYRTVLKMYHTYREDGLSRERSVDEVYDWIDRLETDIRKYSSLLESSVKGAATVIGEKLALQHYRSNVRDIPKAVRKYVKDRKYREPWESENDKWDYDDDWLSDE